ncbi:MAG TPA: sigma 54-interacting transcriptional regulator [Phycisphaerae bacterium]|nr:sigma 54-interacting transcriptional regulator [Phycisphaerae bacterium]HUT57350.1 sigma 54-interacting transcriptional regulator [Phycisphaerae bacterium]
MASPSEQQIGDTILDSIADGVFTVDSNWQITSFNAAAERITGVPRGEAVGRRCCEVFRASICESACALKQTLDTGRPVVNQTVYIINAQGRRVPISISTAILRDRAGNVIGGVETFRDLSLVEELRKELLGKYTFADIIGRSPPMRKLFELLPEVAASESTVLLTGASGTGKEVFARAIHNLSPRRDKPFVAINCGAVPDTLLESELFGHKAGAFTDARHDRPGRFPAADGGTIFLDEIGDVSPAMQVRLLRVLQERTFEPLGSVQPIKVNVRVLVATNKDLARLVRHGKFREDLYYRVNVIRMGLPALRDRREDVPLLVEHFVARHNALRGKDIAGCSDEVMAVLMNHDYPGNVRELENIIEHAFVLCRGGMIEVDHLPPDLRPASEPGAPRRTGRSIRDMERFLISDALRRHGGNRTAAAKELGVAPSTLFRKLRALDITPPEQDGRHRKK